MNRTEELINQIKYYADAYYSGKELISDKEYDAMIEELRVLDPENPLIAGMAGDEDEEIASAAGYTKMKHSLTTGTLDKCMTVDAFKDWTRRHPSKEYQVSSKMDGAGFELQYKDGQIIHLISRGDGYTGFDKIKLVKYLKLPKELILKSEFSVRGEFELSNSAFKSHKCFADKKNPRNAGSGLMNKKFEEYTDEEIDALQYMKFFAYDVRGPEFDFDTKAEVFNFLSNLGFAVPENKVCHTVDEILEFREKLSKERGTDNEEFAIDGIVIFENKLDTEDQLEKVQKKATALKFDLMIAESTLIGIDWSMSGASITPVGIIEPVELDGTTVTRANLCNLNIINNHGIRIGDKIRIAKMGEIIPRILCKA